MANQNAKRRKAIQERHEKHRDIFRKPAHSCKRCYFDPEPEYDPLTSLHIEAGNDRSFFCDLPTNIPSTSSTSQPVQPTIIPYNVSDNASDYYMENSDTSSTTYIDPLAHLSLVNSDETAPADEINPTVPGAAEEGELSAMPE